MTDQLYVYEFARLYSVVFPAGSIEYAEELLQYFKQYYRGHVDMIRGDFFDRVELLVGTSLDMDGATISFQNTYKRFLSEREPHND